MGKRYEAVKVVHLDRTQEITKPRLRELNAEQRQALLDSDLPFLRDHLESSQVSAIIANGEYPYREVLKLFDLRAGSQNVGDKVIRMMRGVAIIQSTIMISGRSVVVVGLSQQRQGAALTAADLVELGDLLIDLAGFPC